MESADGAAQIWLWSSFRRILELEELQEQMEEVEGDILEGSERCNMTSFGSYISRWKKHSKLDVSITVLSLVLLDTVLHGRAVSG